MTNITDSLNFVQAEINDLNFITQKTLALHAFESQDKNLDLPVNENFEPEVKNWLSLELSNPSSLIFTIQYQGKNIGFAFLKILPSPNDFTEYSSFGLIQSLWIDEDYRKNSLGKKVVAFIESILKEQKISYYEVNYSAKNKVAENFWGNCGLAPTSVTARKFLS